MYLLYIVQSILLMLGETKQVSEAAEETGLLLQKLHLEDNPLALSEEAKRRQFDSRIQALRSEPSFLSSLKSEQLSVGSGERKPAIRGRLDMLHTPALGGLLTTTVDSNKSVAKLEEIPQRPYVVPSRADRLVDEEVASTTGRDFFESDFQFQLNNEKSNQSLDNDISNIESARDSNKQPNIVTSLIPSEKSYSQSSFYTQPSKSSVLSSRTAMSSVLPQDQIGLNEAGKRSDEPRVSEQSQLGLGLSNRRDFDGVTGLPDVPLLSYRPEVVIGTIEKESDDTVHVYADPPSMDSNLSKNMWDV